MKLVSTGVDATKCLIRTQLLDDGLSPLHFYWYRRQGNILECAACFPIDNDWLTPDPGGLVAAERQRCQYLSECMSSDCLLLFDGVGLSLEAAHPSFDQRLQSL